MICWFSDRSKLDAGREVRDQAHAQVGAGAGEGPALPPRREHAAPRRRRATSLSLNEIGRVTLRTTQPLFFDEYRRNRGTGSFILVDEATNDTVAAGHDRLRPPAALDVSPFAPARMRPWSTRLRRPGSVIAADYEAARPSYPPEAVAWFVEQLAHRARRAGSSTSRRVPASSPGCSRRPAPT